MSNLLGTPAERELREAKRRVKVEKETVLHQERKLNVAKEDLRKATEDVAYWEGIVALEQNG